MHLLRAQRGQIGDGDVPVDPGQSPADIVVLTVNDAEIAALAAAQLRLGEGAPSLRLGRMSWLTHPYSVDLYLGATLEQSKLVIARVMGGEAYFAYALEQFAIRLGQASVPFAALPGDDKPDPAMAAYSTVAAEDRRALWTFMTEGGPENAEGFLRHAAHMLGRGERPPEPTPFLRAGTYAPGGRLGDADGLRRTWAEGAPVAALVFYRTLLQGAGLGAVDAMVAALREEGLNPLPVFVASLKEEVSAATLAALFAQSPPAVVLNATSFAVGSVGGADGPQRAPTPLDRPGVPVIQMVFSSGSEAVWAEGERGLGPRDIAMNVALPEVDGRILAGAVAFKGEVRTDDATQCPILSFQPRADRVRHAARLAASWVRLARMPVAERRVAVVLANYPNRDARLANGVGLDTPESCASVLGAMAEAGYDVEGAPADGAALMARLTAGPTNALDGRAMRTGGTLLALSAYREEFGQLPRAVRDAVAAQWGEPEADPFVEEGAFRLALHRFGNIVVGVQPARGYNIDPQATYHSPDLVPPHNYFAYYFWLRRTFDAVAVVHLGKHGNLEWLPGKAVALSEECFPEAVLGAVPHLYPFIVNDPGEGTQAKRRAAAVIVDHLTPPLSRAESYGELRALEALVDEYHAASTMDARRLDYLRREVFSLSEASGLAKDAGVADGDDTDSRLRKLDDFLCELKESQIRDGLHVFGRVPEGGLETSLLAALARLPRGEGPEAASLVRALAADLELGFDPLDCTMAEPWAGPRPAALADLTADLWRITGDTVERLELMAERLIDGRAVAQPEWPATVAALKGVEERLRPALRSCASAELDGFLAGLEGRFVPPGPSGAPTRGRPDVLPTGRNFYSLDSRAVPTPAAWALGWKSAHRLIERHVQDHGDWPKGVVLTAWGTANMRTGGDDIAQGLALMGVKPVWDDTSRRVTGFDILPQGVLGRPRVDVTLRVSGLFRDAFPTQIDLFDSAARAVMALDEPQAENPAAARFRAEGGGHAAGFRVFGSKPGAYGAGLQAMLDEKLWADRGDLAEAYLTWGGYAYGGGADGVAARGALETRLAQVEAVLQNQDNREHDLLDSDDYYQFEGGAAAAVEALRGQAPAVYHNDHSRPERPVIRTLQEEVARVVRARVVNPKWIDGMKRHGYKGAFEMAATVDYLFAFAATTHSVADHHFDLVHAAYLEDPETRAFIASANPAALADIAARLAEAIERGLWRPRSNSAGQALSSLAGAEA
jgi:cobaltochelatase CobN